MDFIGFKYVYSERCSGLCWHGDIHNIECGLIKQKAGVQCGIEQQTCMISLPCSEEAVQIHAERQDHTDAQQHIQVYRGTFIQIYTHLQ